MVPAPPALPRPHRPARHPLPSLTPPSAPTTAGRLTARAACATCRAPRRPPGPSARSPARTRCGAPALQPRVKTVALNRAACCVGGLGFCCDLRARGWDARPARCLAARSECRRAHWATVGLPRRTADRSPLPRARASCATQTLARHGCKGRPPQPPPTPSPIPCHHGRTPPHSSTPTQPPPRRATTGRGARRLCVAVLRRQAHAPRRAPADPSHARARGGARRGARGALLAAAALGLVAHSISCFFGRVGAVSCWGCEAQRGLALPPLDREARSSGGRCQALCPPSPSPKGTLTFLVGCCGANPPQPCSPTHSPSLPHPTNVPCPTFLRLSSPLPSKSPSKTPGPQVARGLRRDRVRRPPLERVRQRCARVLDPCVLRAACIPSPCSASARAAPCGGPPDQLTPLAPDTTPS
jgi:hypothetical protein